MENKLVEGWFDPRFPTIQGCIRRGVDVEALRAFIYAQVDRLLALFTVPLLWTLTVTANLPHPLLLTTIHTHTHTGRV